MKIKPLNIDDASECPFYISSNKNKFCFMKTNISYGQVLTMVDNPEFSHTDWERDCKGEFSNCSFINLLYDLREDTIAEPKIVLESEDYSDFNPFEEEEEEEENTAEHSPIKQSEDLIHVKIQGVDNIYNVKVDAIVYPNNQMLLIDDEELNYRSQDLIQAELDKIIPPVNLGSVYRTSNGGNRKNGVVPQKVYHAVVAAQSRLVSEAAIAKSTVKALSQADDDGCQSIAMLPMDCGNFDLHQTAVAQLSAIYNFLENTPTKNLKYIFIITTKNDKVTLDIFNEKFDRIFGEN